MAGTSTTRTVIASLAVAFVAGVAVGGTALTRRRSTVEHVPETNAIGPHLAVLVVAIALGITVWAMRSRLRSRTRTFTPLRVALAALPALLVVYLTFRAGLQVTAGLDPAFTVNAWGGPSYLGAMAAHYLDAAVIATLASVAVWLICSRRDSPPPVAPSPL